ncbi:ABC transporter permease [Microbacterium capsulatum]|uniref:ABC transporter permease n=1 Tax=Microbacterium capsulatum TaxID=3041921 RepID=A0ABU0XDQ3_9MICO|nr:ABC transporter permease [Microbacterium sp. ASV81]MDQ4213082.1 ABC transporter permease [Microbacterium sp. ASV81]
MATYILRRLSYGVITLLIIAIVTFLLIFSAGDPALMLLPPGENSPEMIAQIRETFGFDQPLYMQFGKFLLAAVHGDFGYSIKYGTPAFALVLTRLPATFELAAGALALACVVAIPLGMLAARRRDTATDRALTAVSGVGLAVPTFWLGSMLIFVFSVRLQILPASGFQTWAAAIMPILTLSALPAAVIFRYTRSSMIDNGGKDYMLMARAKGIASWRVLWIHLFKNCLVTIITAIALQFGVLIGGAVVTESVFAWPGLGQLAVNSVTARDIPVVMATVLVGSTLYLLLNTVVDIVYAVVDPAVRYGD